MMRAVDFFFDPSPGHLSSLVRRQGQHALAVLPQDRRPEPDAQAERSSQTEPEDENDGNSAVSLQTERTQVSKGPFCTSWTSKNTNESKDSDCAALLGALQLPGPVPAPNGNCGSRWLRSGLSNLHPPALSLPLSAQPSRAYRSVVVVQSDELHLQLIDDCVQVI